MAVAIQEMAVAEAQVEVQRSLINLISLQAVKMAQEMTTI